MEIKQLKWNKQGTWQFCKEGEQTFAADWVLVFGNRMLLQNKDIHLALSKKVDGEITYCSTSGEIWADEAHEGTVFATAIKFEHTHLRTIELSVETAKDSFVLGQEITKQLSDKDLKHIFILTDGQQVNGSELVKGINMELPEDVLVTGGLAGDGERFERTLVGLNRPPQEGVLVAVGLYGERLKSAFGSKGGWDSFGPDRLITKSKDNVLYELDGQSALSLYKKYLGEYAKDLPGAAFYFPLNLKLASGESVVRTILSIDEAKESMTFAGDMPEGTITRLMKSSVHRLIDGAQEAAQECLGNLGDVEGSLNILISCVGRKVVLGQNVDEEVEIVRETLGDKGVITGFYSYGEIAPISKGGCCELHNQTMTITTLSEI